VDDLPTATDDRLGHREEDQVSLGRARAYKRKTPFDRWWISSYSSLADHGSGTSPLVEPAPGEDEGAPDERPAATTDAAEAAPAPTLGMGIPYGLALHHLLEETDFAAWPTDPEAVGQQPELLQATADALDRYGVVVDRNSRKDLIRESAVMIARTIHTPLPHVGPLAGLDPTQRLAEMEFFFRLRDTTINAVAKVLQQYGYGHSLHATDQPRTLHGLMNGFIDLVVEIDGRYWVMDYKSNYLGSCQGDYKPDALRASVQARRYDLQYLIYSVALHRYLRLRMGERYDPGRHFGGVQYLFLRGMNGRDASTGVHMDLVDRDQLDLIEALDTAFDAPGAAA